MKALRLFAILLFLAPPSSITAQTCRWLGGTGNFSDPTKWSCGHAPTNHDTVRIVSGTVYFDVTINPTAGAENATIFANSSTLIIRSGVKVFSLNLANCD